MTQICQYTELRYSFKKLVNVRFSFAYWKVRLNLTFRARHTRTLHSVLSPIP